MSVLEQSFDVADAPCVCVCVCWRGCSDANPWKQALRNSSVRWLGWGSQGVYSKSLV